MRTIPMMAAARNDASSRGVRGCHSSELGGRSCSWIASFGQLFTQLAQRLQSALSSMVRGNTNIGQAGVVAVPL